MHIILRMLIAKVGSWTMAVLGYARVSTNGQNLTGQVAELQAARCVKIYREKASGSKTDRPELAKLLRALEPSAAASDSSIARGSTSSNIVCSELANDSASSPRMKTPGQSLPNCIRPVSTLRVSTI